MLLSEGNDEDFDVFAAVARAGQKRTGRTVSGSLGCKQNMVPTLGDRNGAAPNADHEPHDTEWASNRRTIYRVNIASDLQQRGSGAVAGGMRRARGVRLTSCAPLPKGPLEAMALHRAARVAALQ